jgi:hypothetical protein
LQVSWSGAIASKLGVAGVDGIYNHATVVQSDLVAVPTRPTRALTVIVATAERRGDFGFAQQRCFSRRSQELQRASPVAPAVPSNSIAAWLRSVHGDIHVYH